MDERAGMVSRVEQGEEQGSGGAGERGCRGASLRLQEQGRDDLLTDVTLSLGESGSADRGEREFVRDSAGWEEVDPVEAESVEPEGAREREVGVRGRRSGWQDTLWREWRNTGDEEYAEHLFELMAGEPVGRIATLLNTGLGLVYGSMAGLLVALIGTLGTLPLGWDQASWPLLVGVGALAGGAGGLLARLFQRRLPARVWLAQLTANLAPGELGLLGIGLVFQLFGGLVGWLLGWLAGFGHVAGIVMLGLALITSLGARLVGWLVGFGREPNPRHLHRYRALWVWWRRRPPGHEVEAALRQACRQRPNAEQLWVDVLQSLERDKQNPGSSSELAGRLQSLDWVERFAASHLLAASGGEGVAQLQPIATKITSPLRRSAIRLLRGIEQETTSRLAHRAGQLLCPHCLALCGLHAVPELEARITFYGCRLCRQSRIFWEGEVVAVLEAGPGLEPFHQNGVTRVNWLARRELFDFHSVEIVQATDEEVERFAIQVGNDTDPFRRPRYKQMSCVIDPACRLSENTRRILQRTFGVVIDGQHPNPKGFEEVEPF